MRKCLAAALAAALLVPVSALAQEMTPAYKRNFDLIDETPDKVAHLDIFEPLERVRGRKSPELPRAATPALDPVLVEAAMRQAAESASMATLIYARGEIQAEQYRPEFNAHSLFDSYSSHKGLVAVATLTAMDRGFLKLDDPLAKFIPSWANDARGTIKVRDLLLMQSGLQSPTYKREPFNPALDLFVGTDIWPIVEKLPLETPPGSRFQFNHVNAQVLHQVITAATGMRYADFLAKYLFQPLGADDGFVALDHAGGTARTVCCILNTPNNWIRLGAMLANDGMFNGRRVLSPEAVRMLSTPSVLNPSFAMLVQRASADSAYLAKDLYYFEGQGGQRLYVVPSLKLTFYRTGRHNAKWDDVRFANAVIASLKAASTEDSK